MKKQPLLSLITPVYNGQQFLDDYFNSLIEQTYKNFEIVIINDGSMDQSENIIMKYKNSFDLKINYSYQENKGIACATKKGLELAKSPYIVLMDQDDLADKHRFEKIAAAFSEGAELIMTAYEIVDNDLNKTAKIVRIPEYINESNIFSESLKRNYFLGSAMAFHYQNDFHIESYSGGVTDYDIALKMLINGYRFKYIDEALLYYRVHSNNTSANYGKIKQNSLLVLGKYNLEVLYDLLLSKGVSPFESLVTLGILSLFKNELEDAKIMLTKALEEEQKSEKRIILEYYFYLSVMYYKLECMNSSYEFLEKYCSLDKNINPAVYNNLGFFYSLKGEKAEAKKCFEEALAINSDYLDAKLNLKCIQNGETSELKLTERLLRTVLNHSSNIVE